MSLLGSLRSALAGIALLLREPNARIHTAATLTVVGAGCLLGLSTAEWAIIATNIGLVLALEALNTALEGYVDLAAPGRHELAARAKDAAAGAVLVFSLAAVVVAAVVFGPRLGELGPALAGFLAAHPFGGSAYLLLTVAFLSSGVLWRRKWPE